MPDDLALGVAEFFGQAHLIGVEVVHLAQLGACAGAICAGFLDCALEIERLPVAVFLRVVGCLPGVWVVLVFLASSAYLVSARSYGF